MRSASGASSWPDWCWSRSALPSRRARSASRLGARIELARRANRTSGPRTWLLAGQLSQLRHEVRGVDRACAGHQVIAGAGAEAPDGVPPAALGEGLGVVAFSDVDDAALVPGLDPVDGRVDKPEGMAGVLVCQRHDARE